MAIAELPRANAAACPQLAKAAFASSSQHVREGQRIASWRLTIEELQPRALLQPQPLPLRTEPRRSGRSHVDDTATSQ